MNAPRFLRLSQLATTRDKPGLIPLAPATIWRKVKEKTFPPPVKLSERVTCWRVEDVEKWLANPSEKWEPKIDG